MKTAQSTTLQALFYGLRGILCLGLIGMVVLGAFFWFPAKVHYHVTEQYRFSGGNEDALIYVGIMLPKDGPYQKIENVEISWDGVYREEEFGSVHVLKLTGGKSRGENLTASIEYDVTLPQGAVSWSAPVESFQRLPQAGIESDCDCLQAKAAELSEGISEKDAYSVYSFTADYLTYSRAEMGCTSVSALKAFEIGSCVCAGYARLMTALCRASDIPSQMVIGLVYPDPMFRSKITSFPQNPGEAHAWVEYYSDGNWTMADPTWGGKRLKILQFNRNDGRHLAYGELEQVLSADKALKGWAYGQASHVVGNDKCFRFIATSTAGRVSFVPTTSIHRGWDGRWANMLVAWGVTTGLLCKYRRKIVGLPRQKTESL